MRRVKRGAFFETRPNLFLLAEWGEYSRPPSVHCAFRPRARPIGVFTDVGVEDFAVVATNSMMARIRPVSVQAEHLTQVALGAQQTVDFRVVRASSHFRHVGRGDAQFFCCDQRVQGPANDVAPLVVAMTDKRAERLFGDDFRQNNVVARIFERCTCSGQTGRVRGVNVARTGEVLLLRFGVGFDRNRLVADVVRAEEVRQVQLGGRAGLDANRCAVQFGSAGNTQKTEP